MLFIPLCSSDILYFIILYKSVLFSSNSITGFSLSILSIFILLLVYSLPSLFLTLITISLVFSSKVLQFSACQLCPPSKLYGKLSNPDSSSLAPTTFRVTDLFVHSVGTPSIFSIIGGVTSLYSVVKAFIQKLQFL